MCCMHVLQVGSDDGSLRIWRDTASTDNNTHSLPTHTYNNGHTGSVYNSYTQQNPSPSLIRTSSHSVEAESPQVTLASSFMALPDIAETSKG